MGLWGFQMIMASGKPFLLTVLYASIDHVCRRQLWQQLDSLQLGTKPWILSGDFNTILSREENEETDHILALQVQNLIPLCVNKGLMTGFLTPPFTWTNNGHCSHGIWAGLDRVLCNLEASHLFPTLKVRHLPQSLSDHSPLLLSLKTVQGAQPFQFQGQWLDNGQRYK